MPRIIHKARTLKQSLKSIYILFSSCRLVDMTFVQWRLKLGYISLCMLIRSLMMCGLLGSGKGEADH